jgi:mono/diheme cytochrome c family protein
MLAVVAGLAILSILVSACASGSEEPTAQVVEPSEGEHEEEGEEHEPEEHMEGEHDVPDEAAEVPNPFAGDEESLAAGALLYASNCAICHGETGEGDGPAAAGLELAPSDLHEGHVQENTDGALFFIISHGKPDTPMPAWDNVLDEDERWHVVNFLRTFQ